MYTHIMAIRIISEYCDGMGFCCAMNFDLNNAWKDAYWRDFMNEYIPQLNVFKQIEGQNDVANKTTKS